MTSEKSTEYGRLEPMLAALEALVRCESPSEDLEACTEVVRLASDIATRVLGVPAQIKEIKGVEIWDPQVRFFAITDNQHQLRGQFYLDLYARPEKREGAWMDDYQSRRRLNNNDIQTPIAFLTCNFSPPIDLTQTPLLTHEEVLTLFHEFGHGLQHMLTIIDYSAV